MKPPAIYDWETRERLAFLQNAYDINYKQQTNSTWTAEFKLPYGDYKKKHCEPFNLVEIWDVDGGGKDKYVGLFRISLILEDINNESPHIIYQLEHVIASLLDTSIVGYVKMGGTAVSVSSVIAEILTHQFQDSYANPWNWELNECDYTNEFTYEFENSNLLTSLLTVPQPLTEDHYFTFETQNYPWRLNLKKVSDIPVADIRYRKNILGIKKTVDPKNLCTRLYAYGKKQTDGTRINISSKTPGGTQYIDSATGFANYGRIMGIVIDDNFEDVNSLFEYATALLPALDAPLVSYKIDIQTINSAADLIVGDRVRIVTEDGLDDNLVVQEIIKNDISRSPYTGKITIGKGTVDLGIIVKSFI